VQPGISTIPAGYHGSLREAGGDQEGGDGDEEYCPGDVAAENDL